MVEHVLFICSKDCDNEHCNYCIGGLVKCTVCSGAESSLTTHCYGEKIGDSMLQMITNKQADFVDGDWIRPAVAHNLSFK